MASRGLIAAAPVLLLLWWRRSLPESPRFLITQGRIAEAEKVVEKFERESGVTPQDTADLDPPAQPAAAPAADAPKMSVGRQLAGLFTGHHHIARTTVVLWILWFILIGVNYGFSSWLPAFLVIAKGFTITKSFVFTLVTSMAQIPGYYLAGSLIERVERKWLIAAFATCSAVSALGVALADDPTMLLIAAACLAAFSNGSAAIYYAYTAELYPTAIRTTGMGAASAVGRIGAIVAPIAIGYLYTAIGFTNVFLSLCGALVVAIVVIVVFGQKTRGRSLEQVEAEA